MNISDTALFLGLTVGVMSLGFWAGGWLLVRDRFDSYSKNRRSPARLQPAEGVVIEILRRKTSANNCPEAYLYLPKVEFSLPGGEKRSFYSQTGSSSETCYQVGQKIGIVLDPLGRISPHLKGHKCPMPNESNVMFLTGILFLFCALLLAGMSFLYLTGRWVPGVVNN